MDLFQTAKAVRLRSQHNEYLRAEEDEKAVTRHRDGLSKNARWTVEFVPNSTNSIRLKSCFNKYLTTSDQPSRFSKTDRRVIQTLPVCLDSSVEWEPIKEGTHVKLKTQNDQYLRANDGRLLPFWCSSATRDSVLWDVDIVENLKIEALQMGKNELEKQVEDLKGQLQEVKNKSTSKIEALQENIDDLKKQVEDLRDQLQKEKSNQAVMEESKTQEIAKLQVALQEMQLQFKDTDAMLMKVRDSTRKAAEQIPIVKEAMEKLPDEIEKLKALVNLMEKKIDEMEAKYEERHKISEERRLKQGLEADYKIAQLKTAMQRLEEKNSDLEYKNHILGRQPFLNSPLKRISEHPSTLETREENGDTDIKEVMENVGFSHGKPVAAITIYECLLQRNAFEAESSGVFECLIQMIRSTIEDQDSNDQLAYWLSNTSTLLFLIQQRLKAAGSTDATLHQKSPPSTFLFRRMTMPLTAYIMKSYGMIQNNLKTLGSFLSLRIWGFQLFPSFILAIAGLDVERQVEAKYPAILFEQQLAACVEKIYGIIQDNLKKELVSSLSLCIHAPWTSKGSASGYGHSFGKDSPSSHWQSIIESLNAFHNKLKENSVPPILIQKIFTQVFSYINVQLFNSLLLHCECCKFINGEYLKAGLAELELWCNQAKDEYAGSFWDELKHIRQAVGFLVKDQKYRISYNEITNDLCPILSIKQLYRICTLCRGDNYNTQGVSPDVISSMRLLMTRDSNNAVSRSFLLDDTSSIPFSVSDLSNSLQEKDFSYVKPAEELLKNPAFRFLQE